LSENASSEGEIATALIVENWLSVLSEIIDMAGFANLPPPCLGCSDVEDGRALRFTVSELFIDEVLSSEVAL